MDVDTDHGGFPILGTDKDGNAITIAGGYGGVTDTHKHEYDITHNRTYIDYFDIDPIPEGKPIPVTDVIVDTTREFIVTIANADWSPGGRLTIGDVEYNVVEYQVMLHKALANWKAHPSGVWRSVDLKDPKGNPLVHTLDSIRADLDSDDNPGTLRTTFDATALIYGGLVPSKTSCVQGDAASYLASNRWRGNALVMHLVDAEYVRDMSAVADTQPLDRLRVQDISGGTFYERIILSDGTMIKLTGDSDNDGVEGDAPEYEVYGGITAQDDASFLYESTAFWHWSDKDGNQLGECWSDSDVYRTAYRDVTTRIAVGMFLDRLAQETVFDTFEQLVVALTDMETLACQNTATVDGGCKEEYDRLKALYEEGMLVFQLPFDSTLPGEEEGYVEGQNGSLTGNPVIIEGGIAEGGLTSGPNFESGRRTWIDILSE